MNITERRDYSLLFGLAIFLIGLSILTQKSYASIKSISCETAYGERTIEINDNVISFKRNSENNRSISSSNDFKAQRQFSGVNQTLYMDGSKHLVHIDNLNNFDSGNDYLAITSPKGHKMTYPLNCQFK